MDEIKENIYSVLPQLSEEKLLEVAQHLADNIGVMTVDDLSYVEETDINSILRPVACRKLLQKWKIGKL